MDDGGASTIPTTTFPSGDNDFNMSFLQQNFPTHFSKPSKIVKPNSRNQSPRHGGRRRMTTQLPTRTRSVIDHQRSFFNSQEPIYRNDVQARPISWNPNFAAEYDQYQSLNSQYLQQRYSFPSNTTFAYGLVTPDAFAAVDQAYLDCPSIPLDQMTGHEYATPQSTHFASAMYPYDYESHFANYTPACMLPVEAIDTQIQSMAWPPPPALITENVVTAPTSPDCLPMQGFGQSFPETQLNVDDGEEQLVGMGLYDSPAEVQSASLLFSGSLPVRRKSLKLEESFVPAPQSEADDEDAESEPTDEAEEASMSQTDFQPAMQDALASKVPASHYGNMASGFDLQVMRQAGSMYLDGMSCQPLAQWL